MVNNAADDLRHSKLLSDIRACDLCQEELPNAPRPILQLGNKPPIIIIGQAPGRLAHDAERPFADPSGQRLRQWLGVSDEQFYDGQLIGLLPMGFCFPGTGPSGDLAPLPRCAKTWRSALEPYEKAAQLRILLGGYAIRHYYGLSRSAAISPLIEAGYDAQRALLALPHPSPRNRRWMQQRPWFVDRVIPDLQKRVTEVIKTI